MRSNHPVLYSDHPLWSLRLPDQMKHSYSTISQQNIRPLGVALCLAALIYLSITAMLYTLDLEDQKALLLNRAESQLIQRKHAIETSIHSIGGAVHILSELPTLRHFISDLNQQDAEDTFDFMRNMLTTFPRYQGFQVIDQHGLQILQVNRGSRSVNINKRTEYADLDFFLNALNQPIKTLLLSNYYLDSHQPVNDAYIKVASPIYLDNRGASAVVITEFQPRGWIAELFSEKDDPFVYLSVNQDGQWLENGLEPDLALAWLHGNQRATISYSQTELWENIKHKTSGTWENANGAFTYRRVAPLSLSIRQRLNGHLTWAFNPVQAQTDYYTLIIFTPSSAWHQNSRFRTENALILVILGLAVCLGAIYAVFSRHQALLELQQRDHDHQQMELINAAVVNNIDEAVIITDATGVIMHLSSQALNMFRCKEEDCLGKNIKIFMPSEHAKNHSVLMNNYEQRTRSLGPQAKTVLNQARTLYCMRADGTLFPAQITVNRIEGTRSYRLLGLVKDLSGEVP